MSEIYRQDVLPLQIKAHPDYVAKLQATAQRLARENGKVTADDLHQHCPVPTGVNPKVMAAAFQPKELWRPIDWMPSARKDKNHARMIRVWVLREAA